MSTQALRAVAKGERNQNPMVAFRDFLQARRGEIAAALPKHLTPDRMIRLALTEFTKNKTLQQCTPASVYAGIIQASQLGLEIGVMGQAYLVPYQNRKAGTTEAQFIPGYKGLIALARRSGEVTSIETHIAYENDEFDLTLGIETKVRHVPKLDGDRGRPRLVYGVAHFKDGGYHFEWMSLAEVERIRSRSKAANSGPWVTDYEQMVRKTLIRRMANYLPMSIELSTALEIDRMADEGKATTIDGVGLVSEKADADFAGPGDEPEDSAHDAPATDPGPLDADPAEPVVTYAELEGRMRAAKSVDELDELGDLIAQLPVDQQPDASDEFGRLRKKLQGK